MSQHFTTGHGQRLHSVHKPNYACVRDGCVVHKPTDPRQHAPTKWAHSGMVRVCEHGNEHLDLNHRQFIEHATYTRGVMPYIGSNGRDHDCSECCCPLPQLQAGHLSRLAYCRQRARAACVLCKRVVEVRAIGELARCSCGNLAMRRTYSKLTFELTVQQPRSYRRLTTTRHRKYEDPYTVVVRWPDRQLNGYTEAEFSQLLAECIALGTEFPTKVAP